MAATNQQQTARVRRRGDAASPRRRGRPRPTFLQALAAAAGCGRSPRESRSRAFHVERDADRRVKTSSPARRVKTSSPRAQGAWARKSNGNPAKTSTQHSSWRRAASRSTGAVFLFGRLVSRGRATTPRSWGNGTLGAWIVPRGCRDAAAAATRIFRGRGLFDADRPKRDDRPWRAGGRKHRPRPSREPQGRHAPGRGQPAPGHLVQGAHGGAREVASPRGYGSDASQRRRGRDLESRWRRARGDDADRPRGDLVATQV